MAKEITNNKLVSGFDGCMSVVFLAENKTTGNSAMFRMKVGVPEKGLSIDCGTLNGRTRNTAVKHRCDGTIAQLMRGEANYNEKSMDMTFSDDYNLLQDVNPKICRNIMVEVLKGGAFEFGGDRWAVLGTNGTRNIGKKSNNRDHKFLFSEDGKTFIPDLVGDDFIPSVEENGFVASYKENNCVQMEIMYAYSDTEKEGMRFPYVLAGDTSFNEGTGTDSNTYQVPAMRYSDFRSQGEYSIYGNSNPQTPVTSGTDALYRINADIIVEPATTGALTVAGTSGDVAVVIPADTGIVEIYLYGADWTTVPVTSTLAQGCKIYAPSHDTALDGATAVSKSVYTAIKTAGTSGNAVAVSNKTNPTGGSGTDGYAFDYYDWDFANADFALFDPTA